MYAERQDCGHQLNSLPLLKIVSRADDPFVDSSLKCFDAMPSESAALLALSRESFC